ncbi:MAG: ParB N-terminal domain-containing protein, partial [Alphaproteobacteria bacterium]|nr:ParB N-terminal domain-containing protein [Alphaproteobacteria bacterium]
MSNLKISYIDTSSVKPYEHNARKHNPSQIEMIAKSISKFGFNNPVLSEESNVLVAGHGRLEAAQSMGRETIPAITLIGLTDAEKRAYV